MITTRTICGSLPLAYDASILSIHRLVQWYLVLYDLLTEENVINFKFTNDKQLYYFDTCK